MIYNGDEVLDFVSWQSTFGKIVYAVGIRFFFFGSDGIPNWLS